MIGSDGEGERKEATHPEKGNQTDNRKSIAMGNRVQSTKRERKKERKEEKKRKERKDSPL